MHSFPWSPRPLPSSPSFRMDIHTSFCLPVFGIPMSVWIPHTYGIKFDFFLSISQVKWILCLARRTLSEKGIPALRQLNRVPRVHILKPWPSMWPLFEDRAYRKVVKVKWSRKSGAQLYRISPLLGEDTRELSPPRQAGTQWEACHPCLSPKVHLLDLVSIDVSWLN